MTVTCSRHKRHLPKWYNNALIWEDNEECDLYTGFDKMPKTKRKFDEDDEDIF